MTQSALRVLRPTCLMMNFLTLNFYIMMKRFLLLTLLLSFWGLASAWAQLPEAGKLYYIYCDNDSPQYFYVNSSNNLAVASTNVPKSNDYLWLCSTTTSNDVTYYQFKNLKGKYLAHKGVSTTAYNFQLNKKNPNVTGNVNLFSVAAGKYFVMKYDGSFDQADKTYNKVSSDYSTDYKFVEYEFPKAGETYYIYADTYVNNAFVPRFVYHDSGTTTLGNTTSVADVTSNNKYKWVCEASTTDGQWYFKNLATGKYMKHKGVQDAAYSFDIRKGDAKHATSTAIYSVGDSRYLVINKGSGAWNQSDRTYAQTDADWCTDYAFISTSEELNILQVGTNVSGVQASVTWNGETKSLPAGYVKSGTEITDNNLSINYTPDGTWTYLGLYDETGTQVLAPDATTPITVDFSSNATRNYTAKFSPDLFSENYGDKWVRFIFANSTSYTLVYDGTNVKTATGDYSEASLWCLVGDATSFKLYNRAAGETLALTAASTTPGDGTTVSMGAAANASTWQVVDYLTAGKPGYAITLAGSSGFGLNSYGGAGKQIKFYSSSDNGSHWMPVRTESDAMTYSVELTGTQPYALNTKVANMQFTMGGSTSTVAVNSAVAAKTYFANINQNFTASFVMYRGYKLDGFVVDGTTQDALTNFTPQTGGSTVVAKLSVDTDNEAQYLAYSPSATGNPYRIPAIAKAPNGDLLAFYDHRPCGSDIGYGEVDVMYRISKDNGQTWSAEKILADGVGDPKAWNTGFGDAAVVADAEKNEVVIFMVCGKTVCWNGNYTTEPSTSDPNRVARVKGKFNTATQQWEFTAPVEVTESIYPLFVDESNNVTVQSLFIGSGKIAQSRIVKKGDYYRLYCAMWTRNGGNRVIYSDDFGDTWNILGTITDRPAPSGDEPKCEELPDGRVLLSSRKRSGRYFNIFTFNNEKKTAGSWGTVASSNDVSGGLTTADSGGTNGEVLLLKNVKKNASGELKDIMLQSVPAGSGRNNVSIYYKEVDAGTTYTPAEFATGWTKGMQVSFRGSAYSTMVLQDNNRLAFFFEEEPNGYCLVYMPIDIATATDNAYSVSDVGLNEEALKKVNRALEHKGVGYPTATASVRTDLEAYNSYDASTLTAEMRNQVDELVTNFKSETTDIQLPEDGKAYTFVGVSKAGVRQYMKYAEGGVTFSTTNEPTVFVCRKLSDDTFLFVCNEGKYLVWRGNGNNPGTNSHKGYVDSYDYTADGFNDWTHITIAKMVAGGYVTGTQADLFGYMTFKGRRLGNAGNKDEFAYTVLMSNGYSQANAPFFNDTYSSALLIEDATYPNNVNLATVSASDTKVTGLAPGATVGTFSAPFPVVIPENVTAYYAEQGTDCVTLKAITEATALPANQGVLLVGNGVSSACMVPAADETPASIDANFLQHSAGEAHTIVEGDYILAKASDGIAFYPASEGSTLAMNKAYLNKSGSASALQLNFGSTQTGLAETVVALDPEAPMYDLQGRRVFQPAKGSLIIQNGKKLFVK